MARVVSEGVTLPGPSAAAPELRLRRVFDGFAATGTDYADEPFTSTGDLQDIRTPDEVFVRPRYANCLDLSVAFAGACLDAGLHPIIVLVDPARTGQAGHALVVVWLRGDWTGAGHHGSITTAYPFDEPVHTAAPRWPGAGLRTAWQGSGEFAAVDIAAIARHHRHRGSDTVTVEHAVDRGGEILTGDRWHWHLGIDIGLSYPAPDPLPMPDWPHLPPLDPAYHDHPGTAGPLAHIRARNNVIRFQDRPELDQLLQWCHAPDPMRRPRLATIRGVAGCGKTRLAAELAHQLTAAGWHTGFLREDLLTASDTLAWEWLARVNQPLLIVIDYIEATPTATLVTLLRHLNTRRQRTVVVMTARDTGDWSPALDRALDKAGIRVDRHPDLALDDGHPHPETVYRRAYRAFAALTDTPGEPTLDPPGGAHRWTTLDLVFHAWIATHNPAHLPTEQSTLYEEILDREFDNWNNALTTRHRPPVPPETLRRMIAGISLLTPPPMALTSTLTALGLPAYTSVRPTELAEALRPFIHDTTTERLALRPDALADHLITTLFGTDTPYFDAAVDHACTHGEMLPLARALTRAADSNPDTAATLAARILTRHPDQWPAALQIALTHGGPFAGPLETLARHPDTPLPLTQLADLIPSGHTLSTLALIAATRSYNTVTNGRDTPEHSRLLNNLAIRQAEVGDRDAALATITEAVGHYRRLAEDNPAAHLPDLAGSLNNLAVQQAQAGNRRAALATITEAVGIRRRLAEANPAAHLPNLAATLNNLANQQAEAGDRGAALATITEAVGIRRRLAEANPAAHLPDLAMSLNTLANQQAEAGDRDAALATITEAVGIRRRLAEANPAAQLPDLAATLNNLANQQAEVGDRDAALATITEAVGIRRRLAEANPAAQLSDLAGSLNNLAVRQAEAGDRGAALATITEAVGHYRRLAEDNPAAHLPNLAMSLNTLANRQAEAGDRDAALATITEAVGHYRRLAEANPAAHLPDLAGSLNNLANQEAEAGDRDAALATITEATGIRRRLAEANPAAHLPN
ncbi:hypothetical protein ACIRRA_30640, partial [Nocardia sp. NPDC101769]|uniref:hypothetical protein n=1 Tax=Nocardia sp. NPDC101769 TaxID=3364333 RepID=UPI00382703D3